MIRRSNISHWDRFWDPGVSGDCRANAPHFNQSRRYATMWNIVQLLVEFGGLPDGCIMAIVMEMSVLVGRTSSTQRCPSQWVHEPTDRRSRDRRSLLQPTRRWVSIKIPVPVYTTGPTSSPLQPHVCARSPRACSIARQYRITPPSLSEPTPRLEHPRATCAG